jgi:hypothetical protein
MSLVDDCYEDGRLQGVEWVGLAWQSIEKPFRFISILNTFQPTVLRNRCTALGAQRGSRWQQAARPIRPFQGWPA